MKQFQAISENNQPQPFIPILGWDNEDEVHEYYYANGEFHTPDGIKTNRLILMWAEMPHPSNLSVEYNIFDKEEIYPNCTVQVLTNTVTGESSVGWWDNDNKTL